MEDLVRDTAFGHIVRLATRGKTLAYPEESDQALVERYLNSSAKRLPVEKDELEKESPERSPSESYVEKGSDFLMIDWLDHDPQVCLFLK